MSAYYGSSCNAHDHGGTPDWLLNQIEEEFDVVFDPCPNNPDFDGLSLDWSQSNQTIYVNPPYSRGNIAKWVKKCYEEYMKGCEIVLLIPSYTDTKYFHKYIYPYAELRFLEGRLKFKGYNNKSASFPSMLCIFRGNDLINPSR